MLPEFCNSKLLSKLDVPSRDIYECNVSSAKGSKKALVEQCPALKDKNECLKAISQKGLVRAKISGTVSPELKIDNDFFKKNSSGSLV